jgi:hypothetical protein
MSMQRCMETLLTDEVYIIFTLFKLYIYRHYNIVEYLIWNGQ